MANYLWTGTHLSGASPVVIVKYHGPTNYRGSRWIATCQRDANSKPLRAEASFSDGPIAAFNALRFKNMEMMATWTVDSVGSSHGGDVYYITIY